VAHDCKVLTGVSGAVMFDGALKACVRFVGRLAAKYEPLRRAEKSGDRVVECFFAQKPCPAAVVLAQMGVGFK